MNKGLILMYAGGCTALLVAGVVYLWVILWRRRKEE